MAYCIMRLKKVKTKAVLQQMYAHHYRTSIPDNVDPDLTVNNDYAVRPDGDFVDAFRKRLAELEYYKTHDFRKNGVMAYDLVFEYSPEAAETIDVEEWKKDNIKWLESTFGKENVVSVVYHYDEASYQETGAIHGHAVVLPVTKDGRFSAKEYTGDRMKMIALQDSYAKVMEKHDLERGLRQSTALHTDVRRFYSRLNNAVYGTEMPEREKGEDPEKYIERIKEAWRDERAAHVRELSEKERKIVEIRDAYRGDDAKDRLISDLEKQLQDKRDDEEGIEREFGSSERMKAAAREMILLREGLDNHPDQAFTDPLKENIAYFMEWAEKEREKKKEKEDVRKGSEI